MKCCAVERDRRGARLTANDEVQSSRRTRERQASRNIHATSLRAEITAVSKRITREPAPHRMPVTLTARGDERDGVAP